MQAILDLSHVVWCDSSHGGPEEHATAYLKVIVAEDLEAATAPLTQMTIEIPLVVAPGTSFQDVKATATARAKELLSRMVLESLRV